MKRLMMLLIIIVCTFSLFSCKDKKDSFSVVVPSGVPYLAFGNLVDNDLFNIEPVLGSSNLQSALLSSSYDIVVAPLNLGAKLIGANKSNYKLAFSLTSNNLFLVTSKNSVIDINDINSLSSINIYAFGEAGIPGQVIKYLFSSNSLNANLDFSLSSSAEILATYNNDLLNDKVLMISEPDLSKLISMNGNIYKISEVSSLLGFDFPQACVFVLDNGKDYSNALSEIKANIDYLNESPEQYANEVEGKDKVFKTWGSSFITNIIPKCSITYSFTSIDINNFLKTLGIGELSDEKFY